MYVDLRFLVCGDLSEGGVDALTVITTYELVRKPPDKEVLYCERPLRRVDAIMFWHYMNNVPDRTRPDRKPYQTGSRTRPEAGPDRKLYCCNSTVATVLYILS